MYRIIKIGLKDRIFEISSYNLMIGLAIFIAIICLPLIFSGAKLNKKEAILATAFTVLLALLGGRVFFFALYPQNFEVVLKGVFALELKDFTLYGAVFGAFGAIMLLAWKMKFSIYVFLDQVVWLTGAVMLVARTGCLLNGCCYGRATTMPWGIPMIEDGLAYREYVKANPFGFFMEPPKIHFTQAYEMIVIIIALAIAFFIYKKGRDNVQEGMLAIAFGIIITIGRFIVFFYREFPFATEMSNFIRGPLIYFTAFTTLMIMYAKRR